MSKILGIIDIGSNSIKALVANSNHDFLHEKLLGIRISTGIGQEGTLVLSDKGVKLGVEAVLTLVEEIKHHNPTVIEIIGTSALRDASNTEVFAHEVYKKTGIKLRVLSGHEEARYIAYGALSDPNLANYNDFSLFDLGGGSLECITIKGRQIMDSQSLQLGSVRLTEKYISDPKKPISQSELELIRKIIQEETEDFPEKNLPLVGMGGGLIVAKNIFNSGINLYTKDISILNKELAQMSIKERIESRAIPEFRADVIPVALTTILALAEKAATPSILYSNRNLRYGMIYDYFIE